ncbi:hypothetical protein GGI07_002905 [Coemansia sp. Benny D115]|nr:hypothetical protein GGI07_002905 [Coemansia sp. Benny D115]
MDLVDRKMRDSMVLPTMRCAQCNNEVYIRMIGQHVCEKQPALPTVPPPLKDRGLSSFFGRSKDSAAPPAAARKGADSQEIPAAYKPSLRLLAEDGGDNDDFDFDDMLHNAASYKGGAMSNDSLYDAVSPGTRRAPPVYAQSNSSASVDSMAAGFSPIGMMPSPGAPMHAGGSRLERAREELVADSHARSLPMNHGSGPPTQSGSVSRGNAATLQNSLLQQLAESDTDFDMPPAKQPMPWHTKHVEETLQSSNRRSPAPVASSLSSPVISSSVPSAPEPAPSVAAASAPKPAFTQAPPFYNKTAGAANVMFSPTPSSPESELSLTLDQPSPSNTSQITSPSLSQVSSPAMSPPAWQKNNSVARLQTSHRKTGSTDEARGTLSIGGMMKSHSLKGLRQNSDLGSMDAPGDPSLQGGHQNQDSSRAPSGSLSINRADSLGSDHPRSPPAITVDTQIRLSSRKAPTSANAASTSASPTPTHVSSFSSSFTQPERNISRTATAPISTARNTSPDRQVSRTPTAPSVMLPLSSSMPKPVTGSAPAPNPLDVLASLMGGASQQPSKTQPASTLPSINTQFGGKSGGHMRTKSSGLGLSPHLGHNATTRVPSLQKSGGSGSKGLKSAKLDSLLDDLMGEMQALSAEVRTESDRDSVVSSHSSHMQAAASSPTEAAHRRGRFDSTVSTTSTSRSSGAIHPVAEIR